MGLPPLAPCAQGGEGDKSIAGAADGGSIPAGACTYLPSTFRNPVLSGTNIKAWFSNAPYTLQTPPTPNWFAVVTAQNAGCTHYIPWDNTQGAGTTPNSFPAYAITGQNAKSAWIGLDLVTGQ